MQCGRGDSRIARYFPPLDYLEFRGRAQRHRPYNSSPLKGEMSTKLTEGLQHGAPGSSHHTKLPRSFFQNDSSLAEGAEQSVIHRGFWCNFTGCRGRQPLRYRHWYICDFIGRARRPAPTSSPLGYIDFACDS